MRPRLSAAIAAGETNSTDALSPWTHRVGVSWLERVAVTPTRNAIGLSSLVGGRVEHCDERAKPVAFRPPPSSRRRQCLRRRGRQALVRRNKRRVGSSLRSTQPTGWLFPLRHLAAGQTQTATSPRAPTGSPPLDGEGLGGGVKMRVGSLEMILRRTKALTPHNKTSSPDDTPTPIPSPRRVEDTPSA